MGIITDIHEHLADLERALAELDGRGVDRLVCLGDVVQTGERLQETVALLAAREIPGVWGNHDFGLSSHPSALVSTRRGRFVGPVLDYLATYQPCMEIEDCFFSHVEPWRDLNDVMGLWYFGETLEQSAQSFDACSKRVMFTGHEHRWKVTTRTQLLTWHGETPIRLDPPERYLVVIAAVCEGWCATYDTRSV